jgi:hypothetical protein
MLCFLRVTIHDHLYELLHPRMEEIHFIQEFTDSADGKRRHALPGCYVSDHYASPRAAFLTATAAALQVDPAAQVMLIPADQIFSHGCREVEENPFASIGKLLAESTSSNPFSTVCTVPIPASFGEGFASATSQQKGATLGTVLTSIPVPMTIGEIIGKMK